MTTISFRLPEHLLRRLEKESLARRTTKSSVMRECIETSLSQGDGSGSLPVLKPGESVYDHALPILKRAWGRRGRGVHDLAANPRHMEGFGK
ncbi:MAG TPA: hypothetical protein P5555_02600 [Candidatus Paceibacterota bacterium]|nr:hypothetical protein [Verrucomicrobiota bacterium]HOX01089.1 hypothetical protein [Verrucomicrobiota bacterium]HRZ44063.1 hypothetical protein [Candidatus Paceibacterota bacterium]HRZ92806.1 hypothetical protein [Candidatus Paceibacterota bacterium]